MVTVLVLLGAAALIWFNVALHDKDAGKRRAAEREAKRARIVCPHCHVSGQVWPTAVRRKKGISGGKATGALLTFGTSMLVTGLSRKEAALSMRCGNCGVEWDVA